MPWKESSAMDEKASFILEWESGESTVSELCKSFGISRSLGYRYIARYLLQGVAGLQEQSRAPRRVWNRTSKEVEEAIVEWRRKRPRLGPLKLQEKLRKRQRAGKLPGVSTIALILKRYGLVKKRRRVRRIREVHPIFEAKAPNEIWSVDFKGEFRMGNMRYCYPLTVMDAYSRYVLAVVGMHRPTFEGTKAVFQALFRKHGLPKQIHSDNGEPFASAVSLSRLTRLAVWFMDLGIEPVYSDPGHPEHNGSHERMHEELKAEATRPPGYSLGPQQRKLDAFRRDYNEERPHQALGQRKPKEFYNNSPRRLPRKIVKWSYPEGMSVKYVCRNGALRWGGSKWVVVSTTLIEKYVGLQEMAKGKWRVYYRDKLLGYLDERTLRIQDDLGRTLRAKKKVSTMCLE
jgi:transposase InsO family protein